MRLLLAFAVLCLATLAPSGARAQSYPTKPIFGPAAMPKDLVNTLAAAIAKAARSPDTRQRLLDQGAQPVGNTPEEFAEIMKEEVVRWAEVVRVSGAKAD